MSTLISRKVNFNKEVSMAKTDYEVVTELESAKEAGIDYTVDEASILLDLKVLLRNFYTATFREKEDALKLKFNNGQIFLLSVKEVK